MIRFRPLARNDFPLLAHWLVRPHVARWWADDPSPAALEQDYGGCIDGTEPAEVFIAEREERAIGLIQRYRIASYPAYVAELAAAFELRPDAWSIDYLVGEPGDTHRGWGAEMIGVFVALLWRDQPAAAAIVVPTHAENRASGIVLERNGFTVLARAQLTPDNPADSRDHVVYVLPRPQGASAPR